MTSLYLHIPFCRSKCAYCDFFSRTDSAFSLDEYVDLLSRQIKILRNTEQKISALQTVYFGGGTPSLLSPAQVELLLMGLAEDFGLDPDCEVTLEANPGTVDPGNLSGFRAAGINRLSLGLQSLCDENLRKLGRIHTADEARGAVAMARRAGFVNLSLDLMFALPGQSCSALRDDVDALLDLQPEHISLYGLSIEEGTRLAVEKSAGALLETGEEDYAAQYSLLHERLTAAGYEHYEISNFAKPGSRSRHNQIYWQRRDCLAVGCGAHGFSAVGYGERYHVPPDLQRFRRLLLAGQDPALSLETFDRRGAMAETVYLALRTSDGLDGNTFRQAFGVDPEQAFPEAFQRLERQLRFQDGRWIFPWHAWLLYDHYISHFLLTD